MSRPRTGSLEARALADGTHAFHLRFQVNGRRERQVLHERPGCTCGCGGGWDQPAARTELSNIEARVHLGIWRPPEQSALAGPSLGADGVPLFADYATWWLEAKVDGVLSDKPISGATTSDYRWRLDRHLLPFFGGSPVDRIDRKQCLAFKAHLLRQARELREALDEGADIRDHRGRKAVPLGPASVRKIIDCLAAVLDDAIEDEHISHNPARGKRMRVRVPKPKRTFLEMDELASLLDAAAEQEAMPLASAPGDLGPSAGQVAQLVAKGMRPAQIAAELGLSKSTVSFHLKRLGVDLGRGYVGCRVVCEILGRSGVRASELCDLKIGQVRIHDPHGARFRIPDSKTETGIREVQMSPDLVEAVVEHLDRLRRIGGSTAPEAYLVPNLHGGRLNRQRVGQVVGEAARLASGHLTDKGLPPLPNTTPHSLRRTYISIALLANNFDVKWVMGQVGHADSRMTLDVYAQLAQRVGRSHGRSFDRFVRKAKEQLSGLSIGQIEAPNWLRNGYEGQNGPFQGETEEKQGHPKSPVLRGLSEVARVGIEPTTPRFSVVCSTN